MKTRYVKTAYTGGGANAIDGLPITTPLLTDDFIFAVVDNVATMHRFDAASTEAESSPDVINPDGNAGAGRWILQNLLSTGFTGSSATSLAIAAGSKTLTVQTNKAFVIGMSVKIADSTDPATNWMHGEVTAYTAATGSLTVNVTSILGSGTKTAWTVSLSAPVTTLTFGTFPAGTKMLFYQDAAPLSWTILDTLDDKVVYVTKGSAAGGQTGGAVHSSGTWTQPAHNHTGGSHTHTGPSHTHTGPSHTHRVAGTTGTPSYHDYYDDVDPAQGSAAGNNHTHNIDFYSQSGGTGNTGEGGTGSTGAGGTEATGANATANTWRPAAYSMIMCSKD